MKIRLRTKLSLAFIALTLILMIVISLLANILLERQFTAYIIDKQDQKNQDMVTLITTRYQDWNAQWNADGIEIIGANALLDGLILRFSDTDGKILWDARIHNDGMCTLILNHMALNMQQYSPGFHGGYEEKIYPIMNGDVSVGSIAIGYYGPYFFNDHDLQFLGTLNKLLIWAAIIASLVCLLIGYWMARRISRPITQVIHTSEQIAAGNFSDRIECKSSTREIIELTDAVNRMAQSLDDQERLRKRLTTDVAHELRTPIATLQSHLEAMIDGVWPADEQRLRSCHEETIRLTHLVGDLELLTRYENETASLTCTKFDLDELIQNQITNFENDFRLKKIDLDYSGDRQMIEADRDKLSQVLVNLLANALKYTDEGGRVHVRLNSNPDQITFSVADTGMGISEQDLPSIFDRFYRTDRSRNRLTGGSGIGLTIARAIVRSHNGLITVSSVVDQGSTFTVTLPRIAPTGPVT